MQHYQLCKQVQTVQVSCHLHPPLRLWNMDPACSLKKKKDPGFWNQVHVETSASPTWSTRLTTGCGARSVSFWVHRNIIWQLTRGWNLHNSGTSHAMRSSPKPSFGTPLRISDTMIDTGNPGWTTSNSGHAYSRTAHKGLLQKRLEQDFCWIIPHAPPKKKTKKNTHTHTKQQPQQQQQHPISQGTEDHMKRLVVKVIVRAHMMSIWLFFIFCITDPKAIREVIVMVRAHMMRLWLFLLYFLHC